MLPTGILPGVRAGPLRPRSAAPTLQALPVRPGARTRARRAGPHWPLSSIEELEAPPGTSPPGAEPLSEAPARGEAEAA
jgi:hypothetical protein